MRIENNWLQRFAEGGAGAAGAAGTAGAAPAADAGQNTQTSGAAAGQQTARPADDTDAATPQTAAPAPRPSFDELIRGPYKADFDARVQSIVKGRLARVQKAETGAAKMQDVMDELARRYSCGNEDYDGILQAVQGDDPAAQRTRALLRQEAQARREWADILRQSKALQQKNPSFTLRAEMANPATVRLLRAGVPLETVYALNHRRELTAAAAAAGAAQVAAGVAANRARPPEAGGAGTGTARTGIDPAQLTRAQREDIKRRVANGERIVLSDYVPK